MTQLLTDIKTYNELKDCEWEEPLKAMINDYKKWSKKSLHNKTMRELYLDIIKILEKELENGRKDNTNSQRTLGRYTLGHKQAHRQARDRDNDPTHPVQKVIRATPQGVPCAGGQTEQRKVRYRLANRL